MTDYEANHPDRGQLVFLGTGTSHGVPVIGCPCPVCTSELPENQRTRSSVVLALPEGNLLIDTAPELRLQLVRERIGRIDAVCYTHEHADHLNGLDDLRIFPYFLKHDLPVYCDETVERRIRTVFDYAFNPAFRKIPAGGVPRLELHRIEPYRPFEVLGATIVPIRQLHGRFETLGFRIGPFAYCTDVKKIPPESQPYLEGVETLVLGCLRHEPHETHMNLEEALEVVDRFRPKRTFFTHISHRFEHRRISRELPTGVELAYDGLRVDVDL